MNFCAQCGASLRFEVPPSDNRPRHVCSSCATVHYQNPKIVAGCIPEWEDRLLLCRRAIEPRSGMWTLPAGFMELGETSSEAALRETLEEANARVDMLGLYTVMNLPHIDQVYMMFRGRLLDLEFSAGDESREVALFKPAEIPWAELAFPTIRHTLQFYVQDQRRGVFEMRCGDIVRDETGFTFRDVLAGPREAL